MAHIMPAMSSSDAFTVRGPARVGPVTEPDADQLERLAKAPRTADGTPIGLFATLAHRPRLMTRANALGGALMFDSTIPERERELVIVRAAARARCAYELSQHRRIGIDAGLTEAQVDAAIAFDDEHPWSAADRALLTLADEVSADADVSDATWAALDGIFDPVQRLELVLVVGFYRMLAGFLNGARVQLDGAAQFAS
jgi:AhpD family alkylhydroperoxidase